MNQLFLALEYTLLVSKHDDKDRCVCSFRVITGG